MPRIILPKSYITKKGYVIVDRNDYLYYSKGCHWGCLQEATVFDNQDKAINKTLDLMVRNRHYSKCGIEEIEYIDINNW